MVPSIVLLILLERFARWESVQLLCSLGTAFRICSKQSIIFLCSFHLAFSPRVSLKSKWCNHTVVLSWLQLGKSSRFILSERSDFHMVVNLLVAVHRLPICMLTSLSVDEILLPRCTNWFTNFRGLPINEKLAPSCLNHMNSVLSEFTKRPIQALLQIFGLRRCNFKKRLILHVS